MEEKNYLEELKKLMSEDAYNEFLAKIKGQFTCFSEPTIMELANITARDIVNGDREKREEILNDWLDMDTCRVCTTCGAIMSEGWYLNDAGYACSDECAAKSEGITMEEFAKYKIYKDDIQQYLDDTDDPRKLEDLTAEECDDIIDEHIMDNVDYFYTEWY